MFRALLALFPFAAILGRPSPSVIVVPALHEDKGIARQKAREAKHQARMQERSEKALARALEKEARLYGELIRLTYARLGQFYAARWRYDTGPDQGVSRRRGRTQYVRFEKVFTTPEVIYFKLLVRKKGLFGTQSALPHRVRVGDLVSDESTFELSFALQRAVKAKYDHVRFGAWILVHRNEGFDALPKHVSFESILPHYPEDMSSGHVIIGIGENRKVISSDLAKNPHMLVAGSTGSGKSNFVNYLICSLMRLCEPDEIKFALIDLKAMEFIYYEDSPYLLKEIPHGQGDPFTTSGIVTEPDEAIDLLQALADHIKFRARLLSGQAKELGSWNKRFPEKKMSRIIVIIDEFAELRLASGTKIGQEAEDLVTRITNLGRAVGIHVIVCTQRPAVQILPNSIKVNMPLVVGGRTPSRAQSAVIIDTDACADLPEVPGRMAVRMGANIIEVQTPYIKDEEVLRTVNMARGRALRLTRLNGVVLEINPEFMTHYIFEHLEGSLSPSLLMFEFKAYGITGKMLKAYVKGLIDHQGFETIERSYKLEKRQNSYFLVITRDSRQPLYPVDPDFVPFALLPAHAGDYSEPVQDAPEPEPEPEPVDTRNSGQIFLDEQVVESPANRIMAKDFYQSYLHWCEDRELIPLAASPMGSEVKRAGFKIIRWKGQRAYAGMRIRPEYSPHMLEANQVLEKINEGEEEGQSDE